MTTSPDLLTSLAEITDRGWIVYSIHQTDDPTRRDCWQITLREVTPSPIASIANGQGITLPDALSMAIDQMETAMATTKPTYAIYSGPAVDEDGGRVGRHPITAADLLARLRPTTTPIKRRL